jgi:hypothetical protein
MFDRVIVAFGEKQTRRSWKELVEIQAETLLVPRDQIAACRDAETVRNMLIMRVDARDLIVIDALLPESEDEDGQKSAALNLIADLQAKRPPPACILVGSNNSINSNFSAAAVDWPLFAVLLEVTPEQSDLSQDLEIVARALASKRDRATHEQAAAAPSSPQIPGAPWALLEVHLNGMASNCRLETGRGSRVLEKKEYPLTLDQAELNQVVEKSRGLRRKISELLNDKSEWSRYVSQWRHEYEDLGRSVHRLVSRDKFQYFWGQATKEAGEDVRLRFVLDDEAYDGLWESIFDPHEEWLMLKSTIARRARGAERQYRLDGSDGIVRMLAIASNVPDETTVMGPDNAGWANFWNGYYTPIKESFWRKHRRLPRLNEILGALPEIDEEMEVLTTLKRQIVERRRTPQLATKVDLTILRSEDEADPRPLAKRTEEALTCGGTRFDVVHFAGHALFNDAGGPHERGYLVFGGSPHTHMVPVSEFALWLHKAGTQMVYLSCCRSSAARAAFALAREGIPLAIGFTWDLDSHLAVRFACAFYSKLLENNLKVCKAFQSARRMLQAKYEYDDPIWASPVLVAQPDEWHRVENYMNTELCFE